MLLYIAPKLHAEAFIPCHNYEESVKSVEIFCFNATSLIEMSKEGVGGLFWGGGFKEEVIWYGWERQGVGVDKWEGKLQCEKAREGLFIVTSNHSLQHNGKWRGGPRLLHNKWNGDVIDAGMSLLVNHHKAQTSAGQNSPASAQTRL